jgi:hypothetical protein
MSLTDSLRSATYNPEAEKAMAAEREKANKARKEVQTWLDQYSKGYVDNYASKTYWPKWTLTTMDKFIKDTQKWLSSNLQASEQAYKAKLEELYKEQLRIHETNTYLFVASNFVKVMKLMLQQFETKKLLNAKDRAQYKEYLDEIEAFNTKVSKQTNPELAELKVFVNQFADKLKTFSEKRGISEQQSDLMRTAFTNPEKFEKDVGVLEEQTEAVKAEEEKKFSFQRFTKKVGSTAGSVIGGLFYVMFCLTIGMLAANQAIGREPAYRILYFIYGAIFAPFLVFYYVYLWFNNKSPKIYTLLPLTQRVADTTIGRVFLFPFSYKEDKTARDLLVEFLTQSAEMVGKSFDPKTLGSIGQQVETVAENLKNLTSDAAEVAGDAAQAAVKAAEVLPSLNKLRVNALKPNSPS